MQSGDVYQTSMNESKVIKIVLLNTWHVRSIFERSEWERQEQYRVLKHDDRHENGFL